MSIIAFLIVGLIAGFLARALMPGKQSMGILGTMLLGLAGSFVGGLLGSLIFSRGDFMVLAPAGLIGSTLGALLVLAITGGVSRRFATA